MKLIYSKYSQVTKDEILEYYKLENEIKSLENVIINDPTIVETSQSVKIGDKYYKILKRTSSLFLSTNMCINNMLELYFIYDEDKELVIITDIRLSK